MRRKIKLPLHLSIYHIINAAPLVSHFALCFLRFQFCPISPILRRNSGQLLQNVKAGSSPNFLSTRSLVSSGQLSPHPTKHFICDIKPPSTEILPHKIPQIVPVTVFQILKILIQASHPMRPPKMSSDTTAEKSHIHLEQRKSLITLEATIDALILHTLDASQLDQLNIKRQSMALEKGSDLKPHFFAPKANLPQPSKKLIRKSVEHLNNKDAFADPMSRVYHFEVAWSSYAFSYANFRCENEQWRSMKSVSFIVILIYVFVVSVHSI